MRSRRCASCLKGAASVKEIVLPKTKEQSRQSFQLKRTSLAISQVRDVCNDLAAVDKRHDALILCVKCRVTQLLRFLVGVPWCSLQPFGSFAGHANAIIGSSLSEHTSAHHNRKCANPYCKRSNKYCKYIYIYIWIYMICIQ